MNHLLDATASGEVTRVQRAAIDKHLESCPACSEDWANFREMAALPIPAASAALRGRIAATVQAQLAASPRRVFRPFLVGGLLLLGAAAATALVLQYSQRNSRNVSPVEWARVDAPAAPDPVEPMPEAGAPVVEEPDAPLTAVADKTQYPSLDPHGVVVLKRPEVAADARVILLLGRCHDAMVRQMRGIKGLNVMADAAVSLYEGNIQPRLGAEPVAEFTLAPADREIARRVGAGNVAVISNRQGCSARIFNTETGMLIAGVAAGIAPADNNWDPLAKALANNVRDQILLNVAALSADARATLLDTTRGEADRRDALQKLADKACVYSAKAVRCKFDQEVIAAALQLAKSTDSSTRGSVWAMLRGAADPALVQPLLQSLASDSDASARMQAALTLYSFLDVPGVREALQRAATEDPESSAKVACCIWTVREAAERASIADADLPDWIRGKLFDTTLPTRSRLLNLMAVPDGRFMMMSIADLGPDAPSAVFEMGRFEQNPTVRQMAWQVLSQAAPNEAFVAVLMGDMTSSPHEYVRSTAAQVLERYTSNPEVKRAFERALQDPSIEVRRVAMRVTGNTGN